LLLVFVGSVLAYPDYYALPPEIAGKYRRSSCSCISDAAIGEKCDDNWALEYEVYQTNIYGFTARSLTSANVFTGFVFDAEQLFFTGILGVSQLCEGSFQSGFSCRRLPPNGTEICTVNFFCDSGPCQAESVAVNIRSIMYPLLGFIIGAFWIIMIAVAPLTKILRSFAGIIVLAISVLQFLLMFLLLVTPGAYYGLMFMLAACLQIICAQNATSGYWRLCAGVAIWSFVSLLGMNRLIGYHYAANYSWSPQWVPFDNIYDKVSSRSCYFWFGTTDAEARCTGYMGFALWILSFSIFLQPIVAFLAMLNWESSSQSDKGEEEMREPAKTTDI